MDNRELRDALRAGRLPAGGVPEIRHFELASGFTLGVATAYPRYWHGVYEIWVTQVDAELAFDVLDPFYPALMGRAHGQYAAPHDQGSLGIAWRCPESLVWEILHLQPHAQVVMGTLTGSYPDRTLWPWHVMGPTGAIPTCDPNAPLPVHTEAMCEPSACQCAYRSYSQHVAMLDDDTGFWQLVT